MEKAVEDLKKEFIDIFTNNIKRDGADKLLEYLHNNCDFFTAPASGRRHNAVEGGLVDHSINVYNRFKKAVIAEYGEDYNTSISDESIAICSLLHDVCKINTYTVDYRNQKVDGQWIQVPYYAYNNSLPYGHGEKSVYIISGFMRLSREEAFAIRYHMRFSGNDDVTNVGDSFEMFPLSFALNTADSEASFYMEKR